MDENHREAVQTSLRLALKPSEAAHALGCSRDFFDEHIGPDLRWVRRGRSKFVAVVELATERRSHPGERAPRALAQLAGTRQKVATRVWGAVSSHTQFTQQLIHIERRSAGSAKLNERRSATTPSTW